MIKLTGVSKKIESFQLEEMNMELSEGYIMGLVGPNGAGKTTLINMILGLYQPDTGSVSVFGRDYAAQERVIHEEIGFVLQERLFEGHLTLMENANYYGSFYTQYRKERLEELLESFQLAGEKKYRELSRGEELKFQFAFAMSHSPRLLVLDEATGNFDPDFRDKFLLMLKDFIADGKHSVLLATHLTDDLDRIADYITYIEKGKTLFSMDIETLRDTYRLVSGETYKLRLLPKEDVIHMEEGAYTSKALIRYYPRYPYDKVLTFTIPTIEELMYFISKRGKGEKKYAKKSIV